MDIFRIECDNANFHFLGADVQKEWSSMRLQPHGQPFRDSWVPVRYSYCSPDDEDYNQNAMHSDFIWMGSSKVGLAVSATRKVSHLFAPYGELLPLNINDDLKKVFWFHCTNVLAALDESKSKVHRFDDGRIMVVDEYASLADRIGDSEVFEVQGTRNGPFCTEPFKQKIEAQKLTGLDFILLWSDEAAGIAHINERRLRNMNGPSAPVN
jgi:hypothetical protein